MVDTDLLDEAMPVLRQDIALEWSEWLPEDRCRGVVVRCRFLVQRREVSFLPCLGLEGVEGSE